MAIQSRARHFLFLLLLPPLVAGVLIARTPGSSAQAPAATSPAPSPPPSPVSGIRNKISAGDLLSAESILEVHKAKNGEDGPWLNGYGWLARGALLMGEFDKARRYAAEVRAVCESRIEAGADLEKDHDLEIALGAAIEVEAQLIERSKGTSRAAEFLRAELARLKGPVALRSRLNKRLSLITMTGKPAPEIDVDDWLGEKPPTMASLRGKPVLMFVWAEWCGDCKAQAAALAKVKSRYADRGLQVLALTRYYEEDARRATEKARVDSMWKAVYSDVGTIPIVFSTASMERYGGSSTPTWVFVDRAGVIRRYTPTRLTQAEMESTLDELVR